MNKKPPRRIPPRLTGQSEPLAPRAPAVRVVDEKRKERRYVPPVNRTDCIHCLERTDRECRQTDCTCAEKVLAVYECGLYDACAPHARGTLTTPGIRKCLDCEAYEASGA